MKKLFGLILVCFFLFPEMAFPIDADVIKSTDHSVVVTMPAASGTMTTNGGVATLTNKTLTSPVINSPTGIVKADVGLGNVDNTSDATKNAAAATLTNKTITTPTIDIPNFDGQGSSPAAPSAGFYKMYFKDADGKPYYMGSGGTETAFGTGSGGGGINYITEYDAESATTGLTGWANYADAAGVAPVDGTGGSPTTAIARGTSGTPLIGTASFELAKSAANRQGEGVSYAFTIDAAQKGRPLQITFNYEVTSGTYADGDIRVMIYDVTNSRLIEPDVRDLASTSIKSVHVAKFQASSDSVSYRLIYHISSTSASAYTIRWDGVKISPELIIRSSFISDWKSVTVTGSMITNTTYTAFERIVGDTAEYQIKLLFAGAPTSTTLDIDIPTNRVIDTAKLVNASTSHYVVGYGTLVDFSTGGVYPVTLRYLDSNTVRVHVGDAAGTYAAWSAAMTQAVPITIAASDNLDLRLSVPIVGLSSGVDQAAEVGDGRTFSVRAYRNTNDTSITDKVIVYTTATKDSHGSLNLSNGTLTFPSAGDYRVSAKTILLNVDTSNNSIIQILKNGSEYSRSYCSAIISTAATQTCQISDVVPATQGDTISIYVDGDASFDIDGNQARTSLAVDKIQGTTTTLAGQTVAGHYGASTQAMTSGSGPQTVILSTKVDDSHGSIYDTATGLWTAPLSGRYRFRYQSAASSIAASSAGGSVQISLSKNGAGEYCVSATQARTTSAVAYYPSSSCELNLVKGDVIRMILENGLGATFTHVNNAQYSFFEFERIGNP
jgi:hypothetical protein